MRHARKVLNDVKVMEQETRSRRGEVTGTLYLDVIPTAVIFVAHAIKGLQSQHPRITAILKTTTSLDIQLGLENGQYGAGFIYREGFHRTYWAPIRYILIGLNRCSLPKK